MPFLSGVGGAGNYYSGGGGPFGSRIGQIPMPNPYGDLSSVLPGLAGLNTQSGADIMAKLRGELSPETIQGLQEAAASFGVRNGMPGSGGTLGTLTNNFNLRSLGLAKEAQQAEGLKEYNALLPTVSSTQTVRPETQAEITGTNLTNRSAPNPADASNYALKLFNDYMDRLNSPAGGPGGQNLPWYARTQTGAGYGWAPPPGVSSNAFTPDWVTNPRYK